VHVEPELDHLAVKAIVPLFEAHNGRFHTTLGQVGQHLGQRPFGPALAETVDEV
jgi:hypothetical protein